MGSFGQGLVTVALAIVGIAILVVIFNSKNTSQVIGATGSAFGSSITAALGPLGGGSGANLNYMNAY